MKVQSYVKLQRENFPGVPEEFEGVFDHLNKTLEELVSALQGKLSFDDNFNCEIKEFTVRDNTPIRVKVRVRGKPRGVILLDRSTSDYHLASFTIIDNETVEVAFYFPTTAPTGDTTVRILVIGS